MTRCFFPLKKKFFFFGPCGNISLNIKSKSISQVSTKPLSQKEGEKNYYNKRKNFGEQQTWLEHGPPSLLPFLPKFKKQLSK